MLLNYWKEMVGVNVENPSELHIQADRLEKAKRGEGSNHYFDVMMIPE